MAKVVQSIIPSNPYTSRFAPLREWPDIEQRIRLWLDEIDDEGVTNKEKMEEKACMRAGRSKFDRWTNEEFTKASLMEALYEFKMACPKDSSLPSPRRDNTFGYSWSVWCLAAETAGARRPSFSLKECSVLVDSCIEYWHSQIIEWKDHPKIFTIHIREMCQPILDVSLFSADLLVLWDPHITMLNRRVRDVFEGYCFWRKIKEYIDKLKNLGLSDGGKKASVQVLTPGPIQEEYVKLQKTISHLSTISEKALQWAFANGRGRYLIEPYDNTSFLTRFDQYEEGTLWCLKQTTAKLRKSSYFDYLLAGICGLRGRGEKQLRGMWLYLLEYEQELPDHPEWPKMMGSHLQRLIGEASMISDAISSTAYITKGGDYVKKTDHVDFYPPMKPQIDRITKIFSYRTPAIKEFEYNYLMPDDIGERLWRHWNIYTKSLYGKDLEELFELNQQIATWHPQEQLDVELDNLTLKETLVQSGYSYLQSYSPSSTRDKIKTRGLAPETVEPNEVNIKTEGEDKRNDEIDTTIFHTHSQNPEYSFKVNNKQMKLVGRLFSSASQADGQGQMKWEDIYKLMKRIGFRIEEVGGSIIRFVPPNNAGTPFSAHRPHPETTLHAIRYRAFGERLKRRYGWTIDWFERVSTVE